MPLMIKWEKEVFNWLAVAVMKICYLQVVLSMHRKSDVPDLSLMKGFNSKITEFN